MIDNEMLIYSNLTPISTPATDKVYGGNVGIETV